MGHMTIQNIDDNIIMTQQYYTIFYVILMGRLQIF